MKYDNYMNIEELKQTEGVKYCPTRATYFTRRTTCFARSATYSDRGAMNSVSGWYDRKIIE